jgi:excisionase family DNA binding protein
MTADVQERAQQAEAVPVLAVDVYAAARMLGLGRCTVLALADADELPRLHFGRRVVFAVADVEALVEQRRRSAARAGVHRLTPEL